MADFLSSLLTGQQPVEGGVDFSSLASPAPARPIDALNLTPQESALYQRHLSNLYGSGGVDHPDGSRSSLYQSSVNFGDKTYNIPTVYDGKILPIDEAVQRAKKEGLDKFPSYNSQDEAESRYQAMHSYMDADTQQFMKSRKN